MDYYDQIEAYLNNALSESDKMAFEEAMAEDEKLKQAVDDHGVAMDVVGSILEEEVREVINKEELIINNEQLIINNNKGSEAEGNREGKNVTKVKRIDWMRWAAVAVVVFVLGWWGMQQWSSKLPVEDLIANNYYNPLPTLGEKSDATNRNLQDSALYYYDVRDFPKSLELFEKLKESKSNDTLTIHLAHLYFLAKDYNQCKLFLAQISKDTELETGAKELEFYLAIIDGDIGKAESILKTIPEEEQSFLRPLLTY